MVQWLRLRYSTAGGTGSIPGRGIKIPHAMWPKKKKEKKFLYVCVYICMCVCVCVCVCVCLQIFLELIGKGQF